MPTGQTHTHTVQNCNKQNKFNTGCIYQYLSGSLFSFPISDLAVAPLADGEKGNIISDLKHVKQCFMLILLCVVICIKQFHNFVLKIQNWNSWSPAQMQFNRLKHTNHFMACLFYWPERDHSNNQSWEAPRPAMVALIPDYLKIWISDPIPAVKAKMLNKTKFIILNTRFAIKVELVLSFFTVLVDGEAVIRLQ